jgi:hypothetical protein
MIKEIICMKKSQFYTFLFTIATSSIYSQTEILNEDFQSGIPSNWTIVTNDALTPVDPVYTNAWVSMLDPEDNLNTVISSTSHFTPTGTADRWIITPLLSLGTAGNSISWKAKSHDPSFPDGYLVLVSKTGNEIADFTDTIGKIIGEDFEWNSRTQLFDDAKFASEDIYVAFVNRTNNGFKLYLDSIIVTINDDSGISENTELRLVVYPNPTSERLDIQSQYALSSVMIFNSSGQLLMTEKSNSIDVSTLTSGFYYVEILVNGFKVTERFIKQ